MKIVEFVKIGRELLKMLSDYDIRVSDYKYIETYEDFLNLRSHRVKYREAIKTLAEDKKVSERTLERVFKRLSTIVKK